MMLDIKKTVAILRQEYYVTIHSMEVIMDIFFLPAINIVVFGYLSIYLSAERHDSAGDVVLLGMLLWQVIYLIEYSIAVGSLWNVWSRNLSNMFIAPLRSREYILAHTFSGVAKALILLVASSIVSVFLFDFNIMTIELLPLILIFLNLTLFAFAVGLVILGLIFRYGTRIQAISWGLVAIFQPLSAAFFPVSVLPFFLQKIALLFPATFVFEAARFALAYHETNWELFGLAFFGNIVYVVGGIWWFNHLFATSRETGQFVRNEA